MFTALYVIALLIIGSAAIAGISAAPWVPTKARDREYILNHLGLRGSETIVDLGCGDGSVLFSASRHSPGIRGIGYEISLFPLFLGYVRKLFFWRRYRNVSLRFGNLFKADISKADIIFVFLLDKAYNTLQAKLAAEVPPHATVVIEVWPLHGCEASRVLRGENMVPVYIYTGEALRKC